MTPAARKQQILAAIVESFISTGEPVGSKSLLDETGLNVSSATVRNDMAELTGRGYLKQPHTSAGRVPTEQGYRYYIDHVMRVTPLSEGAMTTIRDSLSRRADSPEDILQSAADLCERLTGSLALATTPNPDDCRIRKISFVQTGAQSAMAVLICSNGIIRTKLFRCDFVLTPTLLQFLDRAVNETFAGVAATAVGQPFIQTAAVRFGEFSLFLPPALIAILEAAQLASKVSIRHSSLSKLIFDLSGSGMVNRELVEFLQNENDLALLLERRPQRTAVTIGKENSRVELKNSALFSTRYSIGGNPSGLLAAIAPLRTDYARTIAILEGIAQCAGEMIEELISA